MKKGPCPVCGEDIGDPPGRIGARKGMRGLLVPCPKGVGASVVHWDYQTHIQSCPECGVKRKHKDWNTASFKHGYVLNPLLAQMLDAGWDDDVVGVFEGLLRVTGWHIRFEPFGTNVVCYLYEGEDKDNMGELGGGAYEFAALQDALTKAAA